MIKNPQCLGVRPTRKKPKALRMTDKGCFEKLMHFFVFKNAPVFKIPFCFVKSAVSKKEIG